MIANTVENTLENTVEVPLLDLTLQYRALQQQLDDAVLRVVRSQRFILGEEVEKLEQEVATYVGARHAVGVSSGTDALLVAMMALGIGVGDEVITSPYTFFASASTIARLGASPVFVDIEPDSFNIDPLLIEARISKKTRAIMPVHLFGQCAAMDQIRVIAERHGLPLIEDAAQAIGSRYGKKQEAAGGMGLCGCFSFFPSKNLGGFGDGGLVTTDDDAFAAKLRMLRMHGEETRYHHTFLGGNFRLDALQAAVLRVKLPHLNTWSEARRKNASFYNTALAESPVRLPLQFPEGYHVFNQFVIRAPKRDALQRHLAERKIGTAIYYPRPLHLQECFATLGYQQGDFPISEQAAAETLALPIFPELMSAQLQSVAEAILQFYSND